MFYRLSDEHTSQDLPALARTLDGETSAIYLGTIESQFSPLSPKIPEGDLAILSPKTLYALQEIHYTIRTLREHYKNLGLCYPLLEAGEKTRVLPKETLLGLSAFCQQIQICLDTLSQTGAVAKGWDDLTPVLEQFLDHAPVSRNGVTDKTSEVLEHLFLPVDALRHWHTLREFFLFCQTAVSRNREIRAGKMDPENAILNTEGLSEEQQILLEDWIRILALLGEHLLDAGTPSPEYEKDLSEVWCWYRYFLVLYQNTIRPLPDYLPLGFFFTEKEELPWKRSE